jgi:hypothetical protein
MKPVKITAEITLTPETFSVSMQQYKFGLAFAFFAEYFEGWDE